MKIFLSIGTGPGMGFSTAERFAKEGYRVILSSRDANNAKKLADRLVAQGYKAEARAADAGNASHVASLVADVAKQHGAIDVLHYNAAAVHRDTIETQAQNTFVPDLATNIGGALIAVQAAIPKMAERESGTILVTGGGFAIHPNADFISVSIGKAGVRALVLGLFETLKGKGIHIATVTVAAFINAGSKEAEAVAEHFWKLHSQPARSWAAEVVYPA